MIFASVSSATAVAVRGTGVPPGARRRMSGVTPFGPWPSKDQVSWLAPPERRLRLAMEATPSIACATARANPSLKSVCGWAMPLEWARSRARSTLLWFSLRLGQEPEPLRDGNAADDEDDGLCPFAEVFVRHFLQDRTRKRRADDGGDDGGAEDVDADRFDLR